jgi:hypothetical protein
VFVFAHHTTVAALPVFLPALIICIVLVVQALRNRSSDGD